MAHRLSVKERVEILRLRKQGLSVTEISATMGRSRKVVVPDFLAEGPLAEHLSFIVGTDSRALLFTSKSCDPIRYSGFRRQRWIPAVEMSALARS